MLLNKDLPVVGSVGSRPRGLPFWQSQQIADLLGVTVRVRVPGC